MEINIFNDPSQVPQPKEAIRIEALSATPYDDRVRIFVEIKVTPFLERPNLLMLIRNQAGSIVSEQSVIATMHHAMEFRLHLRGLADTTGEYTLEVELYYETRKPAQDKRIVSFTIPSA